MNFSNKDFVPLHVHSFFSQFDGLSNHSELILQARKMGFPALAITDHGNMMGAISFLKEAKKTKTKNGDPIDLPPIKPIIGAEFYLARQMDVGQYDGNKKNNKAKELQPEGRKGNRHIILLARNYEGYQNLAMLSQKSWTDGFYSDPRIDIELLSKHSKGLMCGSACLSSVINFNLLNDRYDCAKYICGLFKEMFENNFYLEVMYHGIPEERVIIPDIFKLGKELDIPVVATNDCFLGDTLVSAKDGCRKIKDLSVGDLVWTHKGRLKRVEHVNIRDGDKEICIIKPSIGGMEIRCTKNHPILAIEGIKKGTARDRIKEFNPFWKKAEEIDINDFLCVPRYKINFSKRKSYSKVINSFNFVKDNISARIIDDVVKSFRIDKEAGVPEKLLLDKEFYKVLGLFLAEGCLDGSVIGFAFHAKEDNLISIVNNYFKKFNFHPTITTKGNGTTIRINSFVFSAILESFVGHGSKLKFIKDIEDYTEDEIKMVLKYYFYGDGCFRENMFTIGSVSKKLIFQISQILNHFEILSLPTIREGNKICKNHKGTKSIWNDLFVLHLSGENLNRFDKLFNYKYLKDTSKKRCLSIMDDNYFYIRIKNVKNKKNAEKLYNLQVEEDETYIANSIIVHNCHYIFKEQARAQEILMLMSTSRCIKDPKRLRFTFDEFYLKSAQEMAKIFGNRPECITNSVKIAERIDTEDIERNLFGGMRLPKFDIPKEYNSSYDYMKSLAWEGMKKLGWDKSEKHMEAFKKELEDVKVAQDINGYDFSTYFLIVRDYIKYAENNDILVGSGRGCLSGDTMVVVDCKEKYKELKDIKVGDKVQTCSGEYKKVLNTYKYDIDEDLYNIKSIYGDYRGVTLTGDHKILVEKSENIIYSKNRSKASVLKSKKYKDPVGKMEWIEASKVKKGDWVFIPFSKNKNSDEDFIFDLSKYKNNDSMLVEGDKVWEIYYTPRHRTIRSVKNGDRYINVDEEFAWILGKFMADGWLRSGQYRDNVIGFAFNKQEKWQLEKVKKYFLKKGFNYFYEIHSKTKNLIQLDIKSRFITRLFAEIFNCYNFTSKTKHIPDFIFSLNQKIQVSFIKGAFDGDGSIKDYAGKYSYDSCSEKLVYQMKELLRINRIPSSILKEKRSCNFKMNTMRHPIIKYGATSIEDNLRDFKKNMKNCKFIENGMLTKINNISKIKGVKEVYDITVEGESNYLTSSFVVHNSGFGSILLRCLDITYFSDPIEFNFLWERFLGFSQRRFFLPSDLGL